MISGIHAIGIFCLALAAGCAGIKETLPGATAPPLIVDASMKGPNRDGAVMAEPLRSEAEAGAAAAPPPAGPPWPLMAEDEAIGREPVADAPAPPSRSQKAAGTVPPAARAPAKGSGSPAAIEPPRKKENAPAVAKAPEPPLDMAGLKARLRDTHAIGVFTKLALKNQVDDLLQQFRSHYQSGQNTRVASLRQPYDMLVLKVLALVQDSDPSLARTIAGSREAIWGILADPERFNSIS